MYISITFYGLTLTLTSVGHQSAFGLRIMDQTRFVEGGGGGNCFPSIPRIVHYKYTLVKFKMVLLQGTVYNSLQGWLMKHCDTNFGDEIFITYVVKCVLLFREIKIIKIRGVKKIKSVALPKIGFFF
jgi:hypothetical protein